MAERRKCVCILSYLLRYVCNASERAKRSRKVIFIQLVWAFMRRGHCQLVVAIRQWVARRREVVNAPWKGRRTMVCSVATFSKLLMGRKRSSGRVYKWRCREGQSEFGGLVANEACAMERARRQICFGGGGEWLQFFANAFYGRKV